nr:uncharacterized protein LOC106683734 isoform X2 [Halyomorpha halys]
MVYIRMEVLPTELLESIFIYFDGRDLSRCSLVCRRFYTIISNNHLWKNVCLRNDIKKEQDPVLTEDCTEESIKWRTFYQLYIQRCTNWRRDKYSKHKIGGESWFYQGWASYQGICLLPTYTENTVDVFRVTRKSFDLDQKIHLPIPGLEPTFLLTDIETVSAAKSNITVVYKRVDNIYKLDQVFACKNGSVVRFTGDSEDHNDLSSFISTIYRRCGMVRVIEFKRNILWLCDYNSGRLFVINENDDKWFTIDSVTFFKTGFDYVCFSTNKSLSISNIYGDIIFNLKDTPIDLMSFNDKYLAIKSNERCRVETWNVKTKERLISVEVTLDASIVVHKQFLVLLQLQNFSLSCHNIQSGEICWKICYRLPGPPRAPLFPCQMSVILNKFLLIFPSHRYGQQAARFSVININSGKIFYTSNFSGIVVEVSDRLLVTLSSGRDSYECGNHLYIRSYI